MKNLIRKVALSKVGTINCSMLGVLVLVLITTIAPRLSYGGGYIQCTNESGEQTYSDYYDGIYTCNGYTCNSSGGNWGGQNIERSFVANANTGKPVSYDYTISEFGTASGYGSTTYDPTTGNKIKDTYTQPNGYSSSHTYDPETERQTSYTQTNSDGSGYSYTYDPTTGQQTSSMNKYQNGRFAAYLKDPETGYAADAYGNCNDGFCVGIPSEGVKNAYTLDENGRLVSKMNCTAYYKTVKDCTTTIYNDKGKVVAIYDDNNNPLEAYDYDNNGNLKTTYGNQCEITNCAGNYLVQGNSCVSECGNGYRTMDGWCNKIRWTPAEAAEVLTDDNNNVVTLTFRK